MTSGGDRSQTRWDRKKELTRTKIIDITISLIEKQGFEQTSMEQIAEEADLAKGTLYNYFPNKGAVLAAYAQRTVHNYEPVWQKIIDSNPDTRSRFEALLEFCYEWLLHNKNSFKIYLISRLHDKVSLWSDPEDQRSGIQGVYESIIRRGQEEGEIRKDITAEAMAALFHSNMAAVIMGWLMQGESFPIRLALTNTIDLFLSGSLKR
ncbi:MAG: hypothetical protein JL50_12430 [Peptococcaceae bacterium BICA1-7]|nr:MAG: hypothetical protein JL50_12430 [Peptococcaceae bacterium BICA1-7]